MAKILEIMEHLELKGLVKKETFLTIGGSV
jgi:hypothetical protein